MMTDRPLTGVGIGCFGTANALGYSGEGRKSYLESHSLYVQVPSEIGLLGALVFFAFLLEALRLNRNVSRELSGLEEGWQFERIMLRGMAAGIIVLLITGVFGHSFTRYTWYVYAALGASIARLLSDPVPGFGVAANAMPTRIGAGTRPSSAAASGG